MGWSAVPYVARAALNYVAPGAAAVGARAAYDYVRGSTSSNRGSGNRFAAKFSKPSGMKRRYKLKPKKKGSSSQKKRQKVTPKTKFLNSKALRDVIERDSNDGHLIYRRTAVGQTICAANQQTHDGGAGMSIAILEGQLGQTRYYNPADPANLTTADATTGTYSKNFLVSIRSTLSLKNNGRVPVRVALHACVPKADTSITPTVAYTNGLADVGNPTITIPLTSWRDSREFVRLWTLKPGKNKILQPGESVSVTHVVPYFKYDPAISDSHSDTYQKKAGAHYFVWRVRGCPSHDKTTTANVGTAAGEVDMTFQQETNVKYEAGVDLKYIVVSDGYSAQAAGPVMSQKATGNYVYSLAEVAS